MPGFTFLMEQTLGHVVHTANLQKAALAPEFSGCVFHWLPVPFRGADRYESMPGVHENWTLRGSLRARSLLYAHLKSSPAPNALFIHTQTIAQLCTPWMRTIPTIVSMDATPENIQEMGADYGQGASNAAGDKIKKRVLRNTLNKARLIICWNHWAAESLRSSYGVPAARIRVIPAGVDTNLFMPSPRSGRTGPIRLLFVGGDFERKGGVELLEAFTILKESGHNIALDLVTPSPPQGLPEEDITVHTSAAPGSAQMLALYAGADIFVLPSRADCLPLAILEAMASGLPIVATQVGAVKEAAQPMVNALLCEPRSPVALANAIETYVVTPGLRAQHGEQSRAIAINNFDSTSAFRQIMACLAEISHG